MARRHAVPPCRRRHDPLDCGWIRQLAGFARTRTPDSDGPFYDVRCFAAQAPPRRPPSRVNEAQRRRGAERRAVGEGRGARAPSAKRVRGAWLAMRWAQRSAVDVGDWLSSAPIGLGELLSTPRVSSGDQVCSGTGGLL